MTKSLRAEWLEQASQWHEMYCHDLEVMSLNPSRVKLGARCTSVLSHTLIKIINGRIWDAFRCLYHEFMRAVSHKHHHLIWGQICVAS